MAEFCFIGKKFDPTVDKKLFEETDTLLQILETETSMAHLLAKIGKFSSIKDAKRNGWDRQIPVGWSEFTIGKGINRVDIFIWNPSCTLEEFVEDELD